MDWKEITIYKFANKNNYIQILIINWKIFMPDGRHTCTSISSCFSKKCLFFLLSFSHFSAPQTWRPGHVPWKCCSNFFHAVKNSALLVLLRCTNDKVEFHLNRKEPKPKLQNQNCKQGSGWETIITANLTRSKLLGQITWGSFIVKSNAFGCQFHRFSWNLLKLFGHEKTSKPKYECLVSQSPDAILVIVKDQYPHFMWPWNNKPVKLWAWSSDSRENREKNSLCFSLF